MTSGDARRWVVSKSMTINAENVKTCKFEISFLKERWHVCVCFLVPDLASSGLYMFDAGRERRDCKLSGVGSR